MVKVMAMVVGYSVFMLVLFGLCCFLMSTVNPDRLAESNFTAEVVKIGRRASLELGPAYKGLPFASPDNEGLGYGLERISKDDIRNNPPLPDIVPFYRELKDHVVFVNNSHIMEVHPPTLNGPELHTTKASISNNKEASDNNSQVDTVIMKQPRVKGLRRSINDNKLGKPIDKFEDGSSVILKIIDDFGRPRIEIKLGPNGDIEKNNLRSYRSSGNTFVTNNTNANSIKEPESIRNVIKILPNNTIVLDEVDPSLVSVNVVKDKFWDYVEKKFVKNYDDSYKNARQSANLSRKNDANFKEIVKSETPKDISLKVPSFDTKMYSLKMLIDNKTIIQPVNNSIFINDTFST